MQLAKHVTTLYLERGVEDLGLRLEISKFIAKLGIKGEAEVVKEYPNLHALKAVLAEALEGEAFV